MNIPVNLFMKEHLADSFKRYKFDTVETALNNVDKG